MTEMPMDVTSFTVAQFVVMGIFALLAIAGILFGMGLKRARRAARAETVERREAAGVPETTAETPSPTPPAVVDDAMAPMNYAAPVATPRATPPAFAPAPPPLGNPLPVDVKPTPDRTETVAAAPAPLARDIRQLKGLGPKLAAALAELGITRVEQIAAMSPAELDDLDIRLGAFRGRPARDRWAEQARLLCAGDKAGYEAEFGKLGN
ncbi:helix-hairpin-helix domain-containing protein [Sphingomonas qilianensis]|uniref:Helix-hairpin-helix domain-containing protein n=1 Tax=Sphingomonas qilianensis TaxID=1736690 RepID=A0ABU9XSN4_9SPHN